MPLPELVIDRARRYRDRAEECRRHADDMHDPLAQAGLRFTADAYDRMANACDVLPQTPHDNPMSNHKLNCVLVWTQPVVRRPWRTRPYKDALGRFTVSEAAALMRLDRPELEWALEEFGVCDTDHYHAEYAE